MTIEEIVKKYLADNGYDGLVMEDGECGCTLDDFQPCGEDFGGCEPAYKGPGIPGECDYMMYRKKVMK